MLEVNDNDMKLDECGELSAKWGYAPSEDGSAYHLDLCHDCFKFALSTLRDKRRSLAIVNKEIDLPGEDFGRIGGHAPKSK